MSSTEATSLGSEATSYLSELLESSSRLCSRKVVRRRRPHGRLTLVVSATSLLTSLSTIALVMWYVRDVGPAIVSLQRSPLPTAAAAGVHPPAVGGLWAGEPPASPPLTPTRGSTASPSSGNVTENTTILPPVITTVPRPGYECLSRKPGADCNNVAYSGSCNVTNWVKEKDDRFCTSNFHIDRSGWYYLYSHAWLVGPMDQGVILKIVPNEPRPTLRSLVVKHSIVCWQNCGGRGARVLREAKSTALDVLTTHVSLLVRLQEGAVIGVNITSPNINMSAAWTWDLAVFGLVHLS